VVRVVAHLPLVLARIQNSLNEENGHDLLLVTLYVVLEVEQGGLDRCLERFLERFVKLTHRVDPLALDRGVVVHEQLLIRLDHEGPDLGERVLEELLLPFKLLVLSVVELSQWVHLLDDLSEDRHRELVVLAADLAIVVLERLDLTKSITA